MISSDLFSIKEKVIIVTGGGGGIGSEIALEMAKRNAIVYAVDLIFHKKASKKTGNHLINLKCDIIDSEKFEEICRKIYKKHKRIDVLINNAGVTFTQDPKKPYPRENWDKTININLTAAFSCSKIVFNYMLKKKQGSIINITSLNAERGFPNNCAYVASKGGLKMLGKALARDWGKYNIRVNNLGPGYIRTPMTENSYKNIETREARQANTMLGRWGLARDLFGPCIFLASSASAYITGQDIYVDGGWLANGLPDIKYDYFEKNGR